MEVKQSLCLYFRLCLEQLCKLCIHYDPSKYFLLLLWLHSFLARYIYSTAKNAFSCQRELRVNSSRTWLPVQMFSMTVLMSCHAADFVTHLIFGLGSSSSWFGFERGCLFGCCFSEVFLLQNTYLSRHSNRAHRKPCNNLILILHR